MRSRTRCRCCSRSPATTTASSSRCRRHCRISPRFCLSEVPGHGWDLDGLDALQATSDLRHCTTIMYGALPARNRLTRADVDLNCCGRINTVSLPGACTWCVTCLQGEPIDSVCHEIGPHSSGVFTRRWSKAVVTMDCNTWLPNITLAGDNTPIPVPKPPAPPPPPHAVPCKNTTSVPPGYNCFQHSCAKDNSGGSSEHCGEDLCYPHVTEPSLCRPVPKTSAAAAAAEACSRLQTCQTFAIDTGSQDCGGYKPGPSPGDTCPKFFRVGKGGLTSDQSWTAYTKTTEAE